MLSNSPFSIHRQENVSSIDHLCQFKDECIVESDYHIYHKPLNDKYAVRLSYRSDWAIEKDGEWGEDKLALIDPKTNQSLYELKLNFRPTGGIAIWENNLIAVGSYLGDVNFYTINQKKIVPMGEIHQRRMRVCRLFALTNNALLSYYQYTSMDQCELKIYNRDRNCIITQKFFNSFNTLILSHDKKVLIAYSASHPHIITLIDLTKNFKHYDIRFNQISPIFKLGSDGWLYFFDLKNIPLSRIKFKYMIDFEKDVKSKIQSHIQELNVLIKPLSHLVAEYTMDLPEAASLLSYPDTLFARPKIHAPQIESHPTGWGACFRRLFRS